MPATTTKSSMANRLGQLFNQQKTEKIELDTGGVGFPEGIDGGIAEVISMKIGVVKEDKQNAGKKYFLMRGAGKSPALAAGLQDNIINEPLYDTPDRKRKTEAEHVAFFISVLQDFGVDTKSIKWEDCESGKVFQAILKTRPHCRFRTWKGQPTKEFPNPRVNVMYGGKCDAPSAAVNNGQVVDRTPVAAGTENDTGYDAPDDKQAADQSGDEGDEGGEQDTIVDLDALGAAADSGDDAAQTQLQDLAEQNGVDHNAFPTWAELAEQLKSAIPEEGAEEGGEAEGNAAEEAPWEKGNVGYYKPPRTRKAIEIEVTASFPGTKTANVKEISNPKNTFKSVPWDKLTDEA